MISSGNARLPLHPGRVPRWLYARMEKIGLAIAELVIMEHGTKGFLSRMSDPFWFQALGCVMGMDWHSSGITTSVLGSLKKGINRNSKELGIFICGGKGRYSRQTPSELLDISGSFGIDADPIIRASRLSAKIDNNCLDDGYQLYLHTCIVDKNANWTVVQQGMNQTERMARRYHWHSEDISSFVDDPQTAIVGESKGIIMNMVDHRSSDSREAVVDFMNQHPDRQIKELTALGFPVKRNLQLELFMPEHHDIRSSDVDAGRLGAVLALAYEKQIKDFPDALLLPGVGPRTVQSLALVSEVVYGKPNRFSDPARFSFAHGGKDGHPFPVPIKTYDESISILRTAVDHAKIGRSDKIECLKRLTEFTRSIEKNLSPEADIDAVIAHERSISRTLGGRTCFTHD